LKAVCLLGSIIILVLQCLFECIMLSGVRSSLLPRLLLRMCWCILSCIFTLCGLAAETIVLWG